MKTSITAALLFFIISLASAQEIQFEVRGKYTRGVSKEKLISAQTMIDIRPGYPSSWIEGYTSTSISVTSNGQTMTANGLNENLSPDQQALLQTAEVGSDIMVDIGYIHQNPITLFPDVRKMNFVLTVVPEVEAVYPDGYVALKTYLEKNALDKITDRLTNLNKIILITFTVTEDGEIDSAQISKSSDDPEIDRILLKAINKMPKWKPAENPTGVRVSQEFEFSVGNGGC